MSTTAASSPPSKPGMDDRLTPGVIADRRHVFLVTGFDPAIKAGEGETPKPQAYHVIARDSYLAMQAVLDRIPNLVPLGVASLEELRAVVVRLEGVRSGVMPPFNGQRPIVA